MVEHMDGFERRTANIHGHDMTYRMAGEGPAILLIHGMAGSSNSWKEALPKLAAHHCVIAPDLLGHGGSAKPMGDYSLGAHASGLRDLLSVVGIDRATVVGQSLGGGIAMQLTYQHPEIAERLVLVSSGGLGREVGMIMRLLSLPGSELVLPVAIPRFIRDRGNTVSRALARNGIRSPRAAEMWRAYAGLAEPANRQAFIKTLRSVVDIGGQSINAHDRLYLAAVLPTLIIWGSADPIIPVAHGIAAHEAMPDSRLEIFDGCGHFPHAEDPDQFARVVLDFLATTEPAELRTATELLRAVRPTD
jgi:pimeloyl-ACP methyl ester carboxylesterase